MSNFAIIKDTIVINTIVAESKEVAESVTGLQCVEYGENDVVVINGTYDGTSFHSPVVEESE
jgi:hypothetical protein